MPNKFDIAERQCLRRSQKHEKTQKTTLPPRLFYLPHSENGPMPVMYFLFINKIAIFADNSRFCMQISYQERLNRSQR